jgi:hypothetical protein
VTVREVAEEVGTSIDSCHTILTEDLGMHQVSTTFVSRLLTDDWKLQPFSICENLPQRANDENLLKNVIICDTTWVYSYDKTKQQSSNWKSLLGLAPRKHYRCAHE